MACNTFSFDCFLSRWRLHHHPASHPTRLYDNTFTRFACSFVSCPGNCLIIYTLACRTMRRQNEMTDVKLLSCVFLAMLCASTRDLNTTVSFLQLCLRYNCVLDTTLSSIQLCLQQNFILDKTVSSKQLCPPHTCFFQLIS